MKIGISERIKKARQHAIAVLLDRKKLCEGADPARINSGTLTAMLGMTFTDGKPLTKGASDMALLHWHDTGFLTYEGRPDKATVKQQKASDARLIKTAIAETMKNRRTYRGKEAS